MLSGLLDELSSKAEMGSWSLRPEPTLVVEYLRGTELRPYVERYDTEEYRPEETGGLFEGSKIVAVHGDENWSIALSRSDNPPPYIFSKPAPFIVGPARPSDTLCIDIFEIVGSQNIPEVNHSNVIKRESLALRFGEYWTPPDMGFTYNITNAEIRPVIFRAVSRPTRSYYKHAYSITDGAYVFTAHATNDFTSYDFVAKLFKALAADAAFMASMPPTERDSFSQNIRHMLTSEAPPSSKWIMAQALGQIDRPNTILQLKAFLNSDEPILVQAAKKALEGVL